MKFTHLILLAFTFFLLTGTSYAQEASDSIKISEYLPVSRSDRADWIKRHQADMNKYIDENRNRSDLSCDALFMGSSSINLWKNIYNDMAPMKIIRRSYGGSTIRDMLYNYDVIARGYKPKNIVLYVENDFCSCKEGISVGETYDLFRVFIQKIQRDYPGIPLYLLSFKPSFVKADQLKQQLAINSLFEDYCQRTENVYFVDITKVMYDTGGNLRKDIFESDNLHINQKGYDLWTAILKPLLLKNTIKQ